MQVTLATRGGVSFSNGLQFYNSKSDSDYVRCVRSEQRLKQGTNIDIPGIPTGPLEKYLPNCESGRLVQGQGIESCDDTVDPVDPPGFTLPTCDEEGERLVQGTSDCNSLTTDTEAPQLTTTSGTVREEGTLGTETVDYSTIVSDNVTSDANLAIVVTTANAEVTVTNTGASVTFTRNSGGAGDEVVGFKFVDEAGNQSVEFTQTILALNTV